MGQTDRHTYGTNSHMGQTHTWDRYTDRLTYGTERQTDTHMGQTHTPMKNSLHAKKFLFVVGSVCK